MANQRLHTTLHPHPHHIPSRATIVDHCGRHHPQTYWPCPTLTTPHSYTKCSPTTNKKKWRFNYHINSRHSRSRQFLCQLLRSCENSTSNHNFIYLFLCHFFLLVHCDDNAMVSDSYFEYDFVIYLFFELLLLSVLWWSADFVWQWKLNMLSKSFALGVARAKNYLELKESNN